MKTRVSLSVLGGALVAASSVGAQPPPSSPLQEATPQFKAGTEVVALDLVVRDKKGKLVTDLQESEIEVLEGGVPQKLTSFRAVQPPPSAGVAPGAPAPPVGTEGAARRVVLAFGSAELRRSPAPRSPRETSSPARTRRRRRS